MGRAGRFACRFRGRPVLLRARDAFGGLRRGDGPAQEEEGPRRRIGSTDLGQRSGTVGTSDFFADECD